MAPASTGVGRLTASSKIHWRDWSKASFDEAKKADKPIVLRLSAVWCHWCHVMDQTSDKVEEAIDLLNERYVPIRVDIDKMPDVRERYNFGGYPSSVFLTPDGEILTGGTYIPPDQWLHLLRQVHGAYRTQKPEILHKISEHAKHRGQPKAAPAPRDTVVALANEIPVKVADAGRALFDPQNGGFGKAPKFPQAAATELALRMFIETDEKTYETVVRRTLESMAASAMWDREEKGFFRYSVRADWSEPHYEKMLETNAGLLTNYARAGGLLGREDFLAKARETSEYVERVLRDPTTGLFYGSQDADEEYYSLPLAQRAARKAPFVDATFYTDWNAQMIQAYFDAYVATGEPRWLGEARRALDSLLDLAYKPQAGLFHYVLGAEAKSPGIFADHAHAIRALVTGYELTGSARYIGAAEDAFQVAKKTMWDPDGRRFLDRAARGEDLGLLKERQSNITDNGTMARALVRLAYHRPKGPHAADLGALVAGLGADYERYGIFASELAVACQEWVRGPFAVNIIATPDEARRWVKEANQIAAPGLILRILDAKTGPSVARDFGIIDVNAPAVFFCGPQACSRLYRPGEPFASDANRMARASAG